MLALNPIPELFEIEAVAPEASEPHNEGYSRQDLERLLGVSSRQVHRWIALKWIKLVDERVPESEIARFVRRHPDQYQLNRVDDAWFEGLLFPALIPSRLKKFAERNP